MALGVAAQAAACARARAGGALSAARALAQRLVPRERLEAFGVEHPLVGSFGVAALLCGALPTATFLSFVLFSACTLLVLAAIVELLLVGIALVLFLFVMGFALAIAGGLTVPIALLWLAYNAYSGGKPIPFPVLFGAAASGAGEPSNHRD